MTSYLDHYFAIDLGADLQPWQQQLPSLIAAGLNDQRYGDLAKWHATLERLPEAIAEHYRFDEDVIIGAESETDAATKTQIRETLAELIPWRKGPITIHGTFIDTEWRSDWKWDRLKNQIQPLQKKTVLDVGCGNGYHCLRMLGAGAKQVVGIDPSPRFVMQFQAVQKFLPPQPTTVLPATLDNLPLLPVFDSTFSMGVLYHRHSPIDHLRQLKDTLKPGGELILETLILPSGCGDVLVPKGRYAMMNNVWFIPSAEQLLIWLEKTGFENVRCVDTNTTSLEEQRATEWMRFHSLENFLDPDDKTLTAEGYPAPCRGIFLAQKPQH